MTERVMKKDSIELNNKFKSQSVRKIEPIQKKIDKEIT